MPSSVGDLSDSDDCLNDDNIIKSVGEKRPCNRILDDSDSDNEVVSGKANMNETSLGSDHDATLALRLSEDAEKHRDIDETLVHDDHDLREEDESAKFFEGDGEYNDENIDINTKKIKKVPPRKSKLNALEEIHSESQRMLRESRVNLPYHRPKQRSLADFLNRRKLVSTVPLKAAKDKLTEVWQQIEQREKMAEKFYNSESDESDTELNSSVSEKNEKVPENESEANNDSIGRNFDENKVIEDPFSEKLEKINDCSFPELDGKSILDKKYENPLTESIDQFDSNNTLETQFSVSSCSDKKVSSNDGNSGTLMDTEMNVKISENAPEDINSVPKAKFISSTDIFADSETSIEPSNISLPNINEKSGESESNNLLKYKLNCIPEEALNNVPKISGSAHEVISLDENLPKTGTTGLIKRFMKHINLKSKKVAGNEAMSVLSSEVNEQGEIIKLTEETITIDDEDSKMPKLGKKLDILKATLQQQMSQSREQQLAKKLEEYKLYEEEIGPEDKLDIDETEEEEELDLTETEPESEPEEDDVEERKTKKLKNPFVDDEAEVTEDEDAENSNEPLDDEYSRGKEKEIPKIDNLFDDQLKGSFSATQNEDALDNLLDLCSGNFTSQPVKLSDLEEAEGKKDKFSDSEGSGIGTNIINGNDKYDVLPESDSDEELIVSKLKINKRKIYFSDDDDDEEEEEEEEEDGDVEETVQDAEINNDETTNALEDDYSVVEEDQPLTDDEDQQNENVEEDEEDELARKLSKGYLDGEAELSGSDWESADEDEKDLDDLESELGDEDKISQRKLQKELGKIHFKEIMAEDRREVRLLQELLLEDGELHSDGPKRQRCLRWYNENDNLGPDKFVEDEEGEHNFVGDEDDETWRKTRTEREKYLREKNLDNLEDVRNTVDTSVLNLGKIQKNSPKITQNILLKSPDPKQQFKLISKRGSFLNRSEKILSKLAQISTNTGLNENPIGSSKGKKNMVFAVVSPPKAEEEEDKKTLKRKTEPIITPPVKKLRFSTEIIVKKNFSLLDQLRKSDLT